MSDDEPSRKRQRVSRACDVCRRKKIRCNGGKPFCEHCLGYGLQCVYSFTPKKPKVPRKPPQAKKHLDGRLERIESLLSMILESKGMKDMLRRGATTEDTGDSDNDEEENDEEEEEDDTAGQDTTDTSNGVKSEHEGEKTWYAGDTSFLTTSLSEREDRTMSQSRFKEEMGFCASGTVLTLFSENGLRWVADITGDQSVPVRIRNIFKDIHKSHVESMKPFQDFKLTTGFAFDLELCRYILNVVSSKPRVFDKIISSERIREIIVSEVNPINGIPNGIADRMLLAAYIAVAIPMILEEFFHSNQNIVQPYSPEYLWSVHSRYQSIAVHYAAFASSMSASYVTLTGIVLLCLNFFKFGAMLQLHHFVAVGTHMCQVAGLNREDVASHEGNIEGRKQLFWILYVLDRDLSLKFGKCPSLPDEDISVSYPQDLFAFSGPLAKALLDLHRISGPIFTKLMSATASKKSPREIMDDVYELDEMLRAWVQNLPPEAMISDVQKLEAEVEKSVTSDLNSCSVEAYRSASQVILFAFYHQALGQIHRFPAYRPGWVSLARRSEEEELGNSPDSTKSGASIKQHLNPKYSRLSSSMDLLLNSARDTLRLFVSSPKVAAIARLFGVQYYVSASFMALFIHVISKPLSDSTGGDLELMQRSVKAMKFPDEIQSCCKNAPPQIKGWWNFYDIAQEHVQKCRLTKGSKKGKHIVPSVPGAGSALLENSHSGSSSMGGGSGSTASSSPYGGQLFESIFDPANAMFNNTVDMYQMESVFEPFTGMADLQGLGTGTAPYLQLDAHPDMM